MEQQATSSPTTSGLGRKIRVGLLLNSTTVFAWEYELFRSVIESEHAEISLVVFDTPRRDRPHRLRRIWAGRRNWLYFLFERIDRKLFPCRPDAFAQRDTSDLLKGVPQLTVEPRRTKHCDYFEPEDLENIATHNVDLFLRMGFRILRGDILTAAPLGVWSYHHGDNRVNRGGPAGLWEVLLGDKLTGSMLQILDEQLDSGHVLCRSWSATTLTSFWRNRHRYYWKSLEMIPRQLAQLHRLGPEAFLKESARENPPATLYDRPLYKKPTNGQMTAALLKHGRRVIATRTRQTWSREQWCLIYQKGTPEHIDMQRFRRLVPPRDRFWADPFVVARDGKHYVFLEEWTAHQKKGHISLIEIDEKGQFGSPRRVLERPYHLSYPFMFHWQGHDYMLPETSGAKTIELYRCEKFPDRWESCQTLMTDIHACDATLLEHEGRWWMFVNVVSRRGISGDDELFLFSAPDPLSQQWVPHPKNPIVSNASCARPAGRIFRLGDKLIRPAQNCAPRYGSGICLQEILELTPDHYREKTLDQLQPRWASDINGLHTFNHDGQYMFADVRQFRPRLGDLVLPDRPSLPPDE